MAVNQQDLDAALTTLTAAVDAITVGIASLNTDWEALKQKLATLPVDLTAEVASVTAAVQSLNNAAAQAITTDTEIKQQ